MKKNKLDIEQLYQPMKRLLETEGNEHEYEEKSKEFLLPFREMEKYQWFLKLKRNFSLFIGTV